MNAQPEIIAITPEPTREAGSGLRVWELVNETTASRDMMIAYAVIPPGASEGPHQRETDEFIFYLSGHPEVSVEGGDVFKPKVNELIRIPPHVSHSHSNPGTEPVVQVFFRAAVPSSA